MFADRAYAEAGTLVPRRQPGAVLHDDEALLAHVMRMLEAGGLVTTGGQVLPTVMHSICVHGDTPGAVANARRLRKGLEAAGWQLVGLAEAISA